MAKYPRVIFVLGDFTTLETLTKEAKAADIVISEWQLIMLFFLSCENSRYGNFLLFHSAEEVPKSSVIFRIWNFNW